MLVQKGSRLLNIPNRLLPLNHDHSRGYYDVNKTLAKGQRKV